MIKDQDQHQQSAAWVQDRLGSQEQLSHQQYHFKKFLQDFIQSIDSNFNKTDIEEAFYRDKGVIGEGYIFLRSPEAAHDVEMKLHNLEVSTMFPGYSNGFYVKVIFFEW